MALACESAALVAAQLTAAWAARRGATNSLGAGTDAEILDVFERFRIAVGEVTVVDMWHRDQRHA